MSRSLLILLVLGLACDAPESTRRRGPPAQASASQTPALRVVSLSPQASRFVLALGAASGLVGVDSESGRIPELAHVPVVDRETVLALAPTLILISEEEPPTAHEALVYAPHDLEEALALCRTLGARLVGTARASAFEHALARELAVIGGESFGRARPRIAAIASIDPLTLAGGHSFASDLIQIAGGDSVTHGTDAPALAIDAQQLDGYAPDALLLFTPMPLDADARATARAALPDRFPVRFFAFDAKNEWPTGSVQAARRLRPLIRELGTADR